MQKLLIYLAIACFFGPLMAQTPQKHKFEIGTTDFLLDGKRLQIRCGEIHFARVPREYWQNRIQLCKAMGLNTVCAYLFWNYHEFEKGKFDWEGQKDIVEFCRLAQKEGMWVILRPGPYVCAEWEMGGLPWWLLKKETMKLRSLDPDYMNESKRWLKEVGRVLGAMQVTKGGPILMAQVENEYGYYGTDTTYMEQMRQAMIDAGFNIPLFACNPTHAMKSGFIPDLFNVVNFGSNPENGFKALREVQKTGPLMCGEFYPGWFDTWGVVHHKGNTPAYLTDLEYMLKNDASFSIYMAHGGTTFGLWAGCDRPFRPDVSSYDYDAPISEVGWVGEKFQKTRDLMSKYLLPGETLPEAPKPNPVIDIPEFSLSEVAPLFDNLPKPIKDETPHTMEAYDQGSGMILYRTTVAAGPEGYLEAKEVRDFAWVYVDGKQLGVMDRRSRRFKIKLPSRAKDVQLDILVYTMGRVNFGPEAHDRKGVYSPVLFSDNNQKSTELKGWNIYRLDLQKPMISGLSWKKGTTKMPSFWRGNFSLEKTGDVFLDMNKCGKGVVWVNGYCLGRYWNIGPTQTMYLPGVWLKKGLNEVIVLDVLSPQEPKLAGLTKPVLDQLRPELDFASKNNTSILSLQGINPAHTGSFAPLQRTQEIRFNKTFEGRQFCIESLNSFDGKDYAAISEIEILGENGLPISNAAWLIVYADSEEMQSEDGSANNAINGQAQDFWHTEYSGTKKSGHPHQLVIDLGANVKITGFRYTSRPGDDSKGGKIKDYRIYIGSELVKNKN
jgi:beta-galactosidase